MARMLVEVEDGIYEAFTKALKRRAMTKKYFVNSMVVQFIVKESKRAKAVTKRQQRKSA